MVFFCINNTSFLYIYFEIKYDEYQANEIVLDSTIMFKLGHVVFFSNGVFLIMCKILLSDFHTGSDLVNINLNYKIYGKSTVS